MKLQECSREFEIVEHIASGRTLQAWSADLRMHIGECSACQDVIMAATAIHEEYASALEHASVPAAGLVWRRAELRGRQNAIRSAERPISLVQAFGGACTLGVSAALVGGVLPEFREWLNAFAASPAIHLLIATLAALIFAAPIALYFVFSDK